MLLCDNNSHKVWIAVCLSIARKTLSAVHDHPLLKSLNTHCGEIHIAPTRSEPQCAWALLDTHIVQAIVLHLINFWIRVVMRSTFLDTYVYPYNVCRATGSRRTWHQLSTVIQSFVLLGSRCDTLQKGILDAQSPLSRSYNVFCV